MKLILLLNITWRNTANTKMAISLPHSSQRKNKKEMKSRPFNVPRCKAGMKGNKNLVKRWISFTKT